ncbi:aminotransferase class IV [Candidatus Micrarchaeota archaeon]|nr:aminotransferase class IV [Candidatus Micrarchaeota archaeon]
MLVFVSGQMVQDAHINVFDEGLLYGYGVYETLRVYQGTAFKMDEHIERLQQSAREIQLPAPEKKDLQNAIQKTIQANRLSQAALRVVLTAGSQSDWGTATPSLIVMAKPLGQIPKTFSAVTVPFHRDVAKAKTLNCLTSVLARKQAKKAGCDEAIFTQKGNVLEGTTSNLFCIHGNTITTPKDGVLEGITRHAVIELAKQNGFDVRQESLSKEQLFGADEAFLTSTLKQVVSLTKVDGKKIRAGKTTQTLQHAFQEFVQNEISRQKQSA